ncbi:MAG TPA: hypothetical protein DCZ91_03185 [Lachnospiraceae bacterium]|nr:hypothetical protein [Lachnospiraceae bacterium]
MASWSEKLNQMTQKTISKSKEMAGVAKLNLEISTLNQNIKNIQNEVGAYVLENGLLLDDASVSEWAAKVASLKADIEANTEKIHDLKNVSICPGCGAEVAKTSKFCDKCGTAIVIKVSEPVEPDEVVVDTSYSDAGQEKEESGAACCAEAAEKNAEESEAGNAGTAGEKESTYGRTTHEA